MSAELCGARYGVQSTICRLSGGHTEDHDDGVGKWSVIDPVTTIVIEPPAAFINANARTHFRAKAKLTRAWRAAAKDAVLTLRQAKLPRYDRAHITCSIRFSDNRRRDVGNLFPTAKACVDGLVDAGVLEDDDDTRVIGPDMRRDYPNGPARVTITIEEIP